MADKDMNEPNEQETTEQETTDEVTEPVAETSITPSSSSSQEQQEPETEDSDPVENLILEDEDEINELVTVDSQLELARKYIASGEHDRAKPVVRSILKEDKNQPSALWMYANLYREEKPQSAVAALRQLLVIRPDHQKAQQLLAVLEEDDEDDDLFAPYERPKPKPEQQTGSYSVGDRAQAPVINVNVTNTANAQPQPNVMMIQGKTVNQMAFIVGLIASFFGFFGIAHFINGKTGPGVMWLIGGFVWAVILFAMSSTLVLACPGLIMHVALMFSSSRKGAEIDQVYAVQQ